MRKNTQEEVNSSLALTPSSSTSSQSPSRRKRIENESSQVVAPNLPSIPSLNPNNDILDEVKKIGDHFERSVSSTLKFISSQQERSELMMEAIKKQEEINQKHEKAIEKVTQSIDRVVTSVSKYHQSQNQLSGEVRELKSLIRKENRGES